MRKRLFLLAAVSGLFCVGGIAVLWYAFHVGLLRDDRFTGVQKTCKTFSSFPTINRRPGGGGVVLYYHVAKTGGTSIRQHFAPLEAVSYVFVGARSLSSHVTKRVNAVLMGKSQKILFVELHGRSPGLPRLHSQIRQWRTLSQTHHVPFFAFTQLRDPISLYISAFLAFNNNDNTCNTSLTCLEDKLVSTALPNRQCLVLARGQGNKQVGPKVTANECKEVRTLLYEDWDWVGTTEELNQTVSLVYKLIQGTEFGGNVSNANAYTGPVTALTRTSLTLKTRKAIEAISTFDTELYETFRGQSAHVDGISTVEDR